MSFVHEHDDHGWQTLHRLVSIDAEGKRVEGNWALFDKPAFLSFKKMTGVEDQSITPEAGYLALTEYYTETEDMVVPYGSFDGERIEFETKALTQAEHHALVNPDEGDAADDSEFSLSP